LITTPRQGPATAGPASVLSGIGTPGTGTVVEVVGRFVEVGSGAPVGFTNDRVVGVLAGVWVGRLDGSFDGGTLEVPPCPSAVPATVEAALRWWETTATATVTAARPSAITAANSNFLKAPSGRVGSRSFCP
jgi:hypothetical protein